MEYKTFDNLVFKADDVIEGRRHAVLWLSNNYGISVIVGHGAYGCSDAPYECAAICRTSKRARHFDLADIFPEWGDSVKGWCTEIDVTNIMKQIQDYDKDIRTTAL